VKSGERRIVRIEMPAGDRASFLLGATIDRYTFVAS